MTGGLGFIGSNLVRELTRGGHEVWCCDLAHSDQEHYIRCDVSRYRQVENIFRQHEFDYVYHAAAEYGRWNGEDYYENLWTTNVIGTKNVLRIQESKPFRMIFFSSAEVYGDYGGQMREDVLLKIPIQQMNDYAISKRVGEMQIANSAEMFGTETVVVRPFNVYGPGEHYTPYRGFIPTFISKALHDDPYTVYKGHTRTLEYVDDVCNALASILDHFSPGEIYNLGGEESYAIAFISDLILSSLGKDDSKVTYRDSEAFTTRVKKPDSSKARRDLGFRQTVAIEDGIMQTVAWFKSLTG